MEESYALETTTKQLQIINWNESYKADMASGIGFDINDPAGISKDKKRSPNGIFSPAFGGDLSEEVNITERYTCSCKAYKGKFFEGFICPTCSTPVVYQNADIEKTGWMTLNSYSLITPLMFNYLVRLIGAKNLNNILRYHKEIDTEGHMVVDLDEYDPDNPFYSLGMIEFENRFDEVLDYYLAKNKDRVEIYNFIKEHRDSVFIRHVPVFSLILRPILVIESRVIIAEINRKFSVLVTNFDLLNRNKTKVDNKMLKILPNLYQTQLVLNEIHKIVITMIAGKAGHIRSNMLGNRINFSARCVIVPLIGRYKINDVVLPYRAFLELYKFEIIHLLQSMGNTTLDEANTQWNKATESFSKRIYLLMRHIIDNGHAKVLVNRNPTLNYGSIVCMNVADVKTDYDDLTMSVPLNILAILGGD